MLSIYSKGCKIYSDDGVCFLGVLFDDRDCRNAHKVNLVLEIYAEYCPIGTSLFLGFEKANSIYVIYRGLCQGSGWQQDLKMMFMITQHCIGGQVLKMIKRI